MDHPSISLSLHLISRLHPSNQCDAIHVVAARAITNACDAVGASRMQGCGAIRIEEVSLVGSYGTVSARFIHLLRFI
jgi:hypothetical protein